METQKPVYITGKCRWACLLEPNTTYDPVWSIQVQVNDDNREIIENAFIDYDDGGKAYSLPINNKDDGWGDFVTIKRKVLRKDGTQKSPPIVRDSQNNPWDNKLIGNDSVVNVRAMPYRWSHKNTAGIGSDLQAVQVVDLIEFNKGGDVNFDIVPGGYVSETSSEEIPFAS